MKIAISGGASQGKSTLVRALQDDRAFKDYVFFTNLTRNLNQKGIPINENGTTVTQLYVMLSHYERLQSSEDVVLDRCALDGLAYSMYFFDKIEQPERVVITKLFELMIKKYDKIFYITPELPLVNDGERSTNQDFFNIVNKNFEAIIENYKVEVIRVSGTVEERIQQIKNNL
jgi:nicotinamide riboside kinase